MPAKYKISYAHVEAVVESFYYTSYDHKSYRPFKDLHSVKERLGQLKMVNVRKATLLEYAVTDVLASVIYESLLHERRVLEQTDRCERSPETRSEAYEAIQHDARSASPSLTGWSLLYHVYIRADLAINYQMYAGLLGIHPRTFQRYKRRAIHMLLHRLVELEEQSTSLCP